MTGSRQKYLSAVYLNGLVYLRNRFGLGTWINLCLCISRSRWLTISILLHRWAYRCIPGLLKLLRRQMNSMDDFGGSTKQQKRRSMQMSHYSQRTRKESQYSRQEKKDCSVHLTLTRLITEADLSRHTLQRSGMMPSRKV